MKSSNRLPWLALLIPAGYLPGYFFGGGPGILETVSIPIATAVAFFLTDRLGKLQESGRPAPPRAEPKKAPSRPDAQAFTPFTKPATPGPLPPGTPTPDPRPRAPEPMVTPTERQTPQWLLALAWPLALTACALVFAAIVSGGALARVEALGRREAYSVGIFQQALWWTNHGVPLGATYATTDGSLHRQLAIHFSPLLALLAPFYGNAPGAMTLLWIQAFVLGIAALPLYAAARARTDRLGAGLLALAWLLNPTIVGSPLTGFHDLAFMPFFAFTALWALFRKKGLYFLLAIVALLLLREDMAFFVILMSIPAYRMSDRRGFAFTALILGGVWFLVAITWLMPHYWTAPLLAGPDIFFRQYLGSWGNTPMDVLAYVIAHPMDLVRRVATRETGLYLMTMLRPTGLLIPLPDPMWLAGLQNILLNVIGEGNVLKSPIARYSIPVATALFMALPGAIAWWGRRLGAPERLATVLARQGTVEERGAQVRAEAKLGDLWIKDRVKGGSELDGRAGAPAGAIVVVAALLALVLMRIDGQFKAAPRNDLAAQLEVLRAVPDSISVLAPDYAFARLANRRQVCIIGSLEERALEPAVLNQFDGVMIDLAPESFESARYPQLLPALYDHLLKDRNYREAATAGGIHLFLRDRSFSAPPGDSPGR